MQRTHLTTSMRAIHTAALALIFGATAAYAGSGARYLALGDSVAFGFSPLTDYTQSNVRSGEFIGYPESTADAAGLKVTNASCPGETTGSFLDASQPDNGCHSDLNYGAHLKVNYHGAPNQMAFALRYLAKHRDTTDITINLGGNDLLLLQDECRQSPDFFQCALSRLPGVRANAGANHR